MHHGKARLESLEPQRVTSRTALLCNQSFPPYCVEIVTDALQSLLYILRGEVIVPTEFLVIPEEFAGGNRRLRVFVPFCLTPLLFVLNHLSSRRASFCVVPLEISNECGPADRVRRTLDGLLGCRLV